MEITENWVGSAEAEKREALQKQLDNANPEAQNCPQQLLKKERKPRPIDKLEAMTHLQTNKAAV